MYETKVTDIDRINALYINGVRRYLAKSATQVKAVKKPARPKRNVLRNWKSSKMKQALSAEKKCIAE